MLTLACASIGVIVVNGAFAFWQEYRAEKALSALQRLLPQQVTLRRDNGTLRAPAAHLVPVDVVFLQAGDTVPADCRVIEAFALRVNNATVTGESVPHARDADVSEDADLFHSHNLLLAGTSIVSGKATAVVFATGGHTLFGQIAHLTQSERKTLSPLGQQVATLSRWVALLALGLGALFFVLGSALGLPF